MYKLCHAAWDRVLDRGLSLAVIYWPKPIEQIYGGAGLGDAGEFVISLGCQGWFLLALCTPAVGCLHITMQGEGG